MGYAITYQRGNMLLRHLILRRLDTEERMLGMSMDYLRHILQTSLPAFLKFSLFLPLARHRRTLPPVPYHIARVVATQAADCGTCVQAEVNLARQAGVAPALLEAVIQHRVEELEPQIAQIYRFTRAVVAATGEEEALRPSLQAQYGDAGMVELALGIAAARVYPTTKRALGYATSCAHVEIQTEPAVHSPRP
jgi:alkylhydroperoxidase family enzyme